ncbi:phage tail tape measure protein [Kosakonia sp. SMBL-WEM22]|uniref:phage tail tape measure protein n=1 Tax=Kosakonia sp. SMBL-WEM22 TaxID=2725560 RepID=UPI001658E3A6|nr:phage tail tape measure protein [Kosakonia sp. SMBL-WEM22]QNQ21502.1 phage tail tape measure protein [Kosakonia sp. SMBL-WEM22]
MSNSAKLEELLTAVDQATRPFKSLQTESLSLSDHVKATEKDLRGLYNQLAQVDEITRAQNTIVAVDKRIEALRQRQRKLLEVVETPGQVRLLEFTAHQKLELMQRRDTLRENIAAKQQSLATAGITTASPSSAKQQLQSRIGETSTQLSAQRQALEQAQKQEQRQQRAAKIQAVQQRLLGAGEKVSAIGARGMSIASTGFELGKKIMQPGFEASLKNSPLAPAATSGNAEPDVQKTPSASGTAVATLQNRSGTAVATLQNSVSTPGTAVAALQNSAAGPAAAMQNSVGNLGTDLEALQAAYQSLSVDIFSTQESSLRSLVQTATRYVGKLQEWVQNNQGLVQSFGLIATVVVGIAGAVGTAAGVIAPVFTGISTLITLATTFGSVFTTVCGGIAAVLGSLTLPIVAIIAGVAAAALLIYKYWEPISAFFGGVIEGIKTAFAPIAELFAPFQPLFDGIGKVISDIAGWFNNLLTPVKSSQQTLERFGNAGKIFGQLLVEALTLPFKPLKLLIEGVTWLLDKLGVINKQSADAGPDKQPQPTAGGAAFGIVQPPRLENYQAAHPAAGGSYVDQSKSEYNITLQGDMSPGGDGVRQFKDLLAQHEQDKRNNALAQFSATGGYA